MIVAAIRSYVAFLVIALYVLAVGPPGMLLAYAFGWVGLLYDLGHIGVFLALGITGIRYRVAGKHRVPLNRAAVYCANHQSNVDPPIAFRALNPRMRVLYKAELNSLPVLSQAFRLGGFIPVDRKNKESGLRSIEAGADSLRAGNSFLIFPEGTRSKTDELLPFKKGGFIMAIKAQAPIVPVAIQGGRDAMRKGSSLLWPVTVSVRVGDPIETTGYTLDQRNELIEKVRLAIEALLAEGPVTR